MKDKEKNNSIRVKEITTETEKKFEVEGEELDFEEYLVWLGQQLLEIKKAVI